jgi:hypothetical protein
MEYIDQLISFSESPIIDWGIKGALIYAGVLWLSLIIWVARDSIERSNSIIFQVFNILLNIALPVFGLIIYLIMRPSKTLMERYYEELEYKLITENQEEFEHCPDCEGHLQANYIYCPECEAQVKKPCPHCKEAYKMEFHSCPFCGKKESDAKSVRRGEKKSTHRKQKSLQKSKETEKAKEKTLAEA